MDPAGTRALPGCRLDSGEQPVVIDSVGWRFGVGVPGDAVNTSM